MLTCRRIGHAPACGRPAAQRPWCGPFLQLFPLSSDIGWRPCQVSPACLSPRLDGGEVVHEHVRVTPWDPLARTVKLWAGVKLVAASCRILRSRAVPRNGTSVPLGRACCSSTKRSALTGRSLAACGSRAPPTLRSSQPISWTGPGYVQMAKDRYECDVRAVDETGFDPTQDDGGVPPEAATGKRADCWRKSRPGRSCLWSSVGHARESRR